MDTTINNNLTPEQETTIQEQDVTKTNGAVDLNVLETQASDLPQAPVTNDMTASTLSVAENLNQVNAVQRQRAEEAQKEAQKQAMAQADQETIVRTLAGETLGQGAVETQAMAQAGIGKAQSEIDALDQAILNSSTALKQAMVQDERDVQSLAGQGRGIPASVVRGRQALLQSQRRADRKVEAIQLENDIATSELLQGKVDSAKKAIQRSVELQFADKRAELEIEQQFLSRVDTKEANARKEAIRREEKQMEKAQEEADQVFDIAQKVREAGGSAQEVANVINSGDRNEALSNAPSLGLDAKLNRTLTRLNIANADEKLSAARADAAAKEMLMSSGGLDQETKEKISKDKSAQSAVALIAVDVALKEYEEKLRLLSDGGLTRKERSELNTIVTNSVAPSLAVANGQGAMTDDERNAILSDIGTNWWTEARGLEERKINNVSALRKSQQSKTDIFLQAVDATYGGATENFELFSEYNNRLTTEKLGDTPAKRIVNLTPAQDVTLTNIANDYGVSVDEILMDNDLYQAIIKN